MWRLFIYFQLPFALQMIGHVLKSQSKNAAASSEYVERLIVFIKSLVEC